jgi:superoxide dismutase
MDDRKHSISPHDLCTRLGSESAPIIVDVRRDADFAGAETLVADAPILTLDMYEHSYHIDFGAKAADYVGTFMAAINWPAVRRAYDGVRS